ncbi:MAG: hydroxymethylbilane synthase [Blastocatellia bacterium]|nr:hydroxymethylbilane synthase [Blastocatellia bacterium]
MTSHSERLQADLVIGSRGSALALWQANWAKAQLEAAHPGWSVAIEIIKTTGDKILDVPLAKIGSKGLFTKEIEDALLEGRIDLAVHSLKDLPTVLPTGLTLAAVSEREDVRDALIAAPAITGFASLPEGARVGTSSLRRQAQLRALRPDLKLLDLRGNVDTRLRKLQEGEYDAIVLASAGVTRLGQAAAITERLSLEVMLPAVGQGALGIEIRVADERVAAAVSCLAHAPTWAACRAERTFLAGLGGGCQVPIAANAEIEHDRLRLTGLVAAADGTKLLRNERTGTIAEAEQVGIALAEELLAAGAAELLKF